MNTDRLDRVRRAAGLLREGGVDALLLTADADLLYLTGFEHTHARQRLLGMVLRSDGSADWITPSMNEHQVREFAQPGQVVRVWTDPETYVPSLRAALDGVGSLAFDDEARAAFLIDALGVRPGLQVVKAGGFMRRLRMRKDAAELAGLRAAAATVDAAIPDAMDLCRPGVTELEVQARLQELLLSLSPESQVAFTIVASGPNGAFPHHEPGQRRLEAGDAVILDYGTRRHGYHSDITVTCSVGTPSDPELPNIYRVVWEAQQAALAAVRPGVPAEAIDQAARGVIEQAGYGEAFIHRTGHGLGLQVHEPPYIVAGNSEPLEVGMVFSVEPGIYLTGRLGVRLEVIASVGSSGVELINAPRVETLPIIG